MPPKRVALDVGSPARWHVLREVLQAEPFLITLLHSCSHLVVDEECRICCGIQGCCETCENQQLLFFSSVDGLVLAAVDARGGNALEECERVNQDVELRRNDEVVVRLAAAIARGPRTFAL